MGALSAVGLLLLEAALHPQGIIITAFWHPCGGIWDIFKRAASLE